MFFDFMKDLINDLNINININIDIDIDIFRKFSEMSC
jgi:hypothetical protein